jgi:hypothetical protein
MSLESLEPAASPNRAILTQCEQRAMLATQREGLASQRIPIDSTAELPTSTEVTFHIAKLVEQGFLP